MLGIGNDENFATSDPLVLAGAVNQFIYFENGDIAKITPRDYHLYSLEDGTYMKVNRASVQIKIEALNFSLGKFTH